MPSLIEKLVRPFRASAHSLGSKRVCHALILAAVIGLWGYALYAQFYLHLEPCPLCVFQRFALTAVGAVAFLGVLAPSKLWLQRSLAGLYVLTAGAGMGIAGWHVRLQNLPAGEVPSCNMMGLGFMNDMFGPWETIRRVFQGSGECAKVDWSFLGLSMPAWVLVWFIAIALFAAFRFWRAE
jgi:protein dithiol:quinone oxidoreductase